MILVAFATLMALASGWHSFVLANRASRFPLVLAVAPNEPEALARSAASVSALRYEDGERPDEVARLARRSLQAMALNPLALRLLAMSQGEELSADLDARLIALSSEISRRDIATQVLGIQLAGKRGDAEAVIAAYDVILRNGGGDPEQFFEPMSRAIALPQMAPYFATYLEDRAPWVPAFLTYAIPKSNDPQRIVELLKVGGGLAGYEEGQRIEVMLINRLLETGQWEAAARYYRTTANHNPAALTSPEINRGSLQPRENGLLWSLYQKDGPIAEAVADTALVVYADPGQSGEVGRKLLFLSPGRYRIAFAYEQLDLPDGAMIEWTGRCLAGKTARPLWKMRALQSAESQRQTTNFTIDENCRVFDLALAIDAGESRNTATATISQVDLVRVSRDAEKS